jgi:hypothetical protein
MVRVNYNLLILLHVGGYTDTLHGSINLTLASTQGVDSYSDPHFADEEFRAYKFI